MVILISNKVDKINKTLNNFKIKKQIKISKKTAKNNKTDYFTKCKI